MLYVRSVMYMRYVYVYVMRVCVMYVCFCRCDAYVCYVMDASGLCMSVMYAGCV